MKATVNAAAKAACFLRSGVSYNKQEIVRAIEHQAKLLLAEGNLAKTKEYIQHSDMSVFQHCVHVAYISCLLCVKLKLNVSWDELIRAALLHDYFLYDWHDGPPFNFKHAFGHPTFAARNAARDYKLTAKEIQIIKRHMWPLTVVPPTCREGWIVVLADKICTLLEVARKERVRL